MDCDRSMQSTPLLAHDTTIRSWGAAWTLGGLAASSHRMMGKGSKALLAAGACLAFPSEEWKGQEGIAAAAK